MTRTRVLELRVAAFCATLMGGVLSGCTLEPAVRDGQRPAASSAVAVAAAAAPAQACGGTDAHDAHAAAGLGCAVCHARPGALQFGSVTFPQGSSTQGGTMTRAGGTTTCSVGCHRPLGADAPPVAWNAGPLTCTACHANVTNDGTAPILSTHLVGALDPTSACESCHDQSHHLSGVVLLRSGDGTTTASTCVDCHSGRGLTLGGLAPPLLVGWTDADFHGARPGTCRFDTLDATGQRTAVRGAFACPPGQPQPPGALLITPHWWYASGTSGPWAWTCDIQTVDANGQQIAPTRTAQPCPDGTILNTQCPANPSQCYPTTTVTSGFGGTLRAPYFRGEGALDCAECHDFHASTNAFLLAAQVNGAAVPAGAIDRAGVGAQALCNACHEGDRHEVCKSCHREVWTTDGEYSWFEGAVVDPAPDGSACFYCHGHEGIRFMQDSSPAYPTSGHPFGMAGTSRNQARCSHCHSAWAPPPTEYAPPSLDAASPAVWGITATTATVSWRTDELATSYVEYGIGTAGFVAGDASFATDHAITLTGLSPSTTYLWRVRTSDRFRNVTTSALRSFTTPGANDVPVPDLAPVWLTVSVGTYTADVALLWYPVTAPSGTAVEYEVQLASDPEFTFLVDGSMAGPGVPGSTVADSGWIAGTPATGGARPALATPARITNIPQDSCTEIVPSVYYWRVRARDAAGNVSGWSASGSFTAFAYDQWC